MTKEEEKYTTLDTEQCKWWVNTLFNMAKEKACNSHNFDDGEEIQSAQDKIIKALEQEEYYKNLAQSYEKTINKLTKAIAEQQPSEDCVRVENRQRWIPVSEMLPKESDGAVLITANGEVNTGRYSEFSNTWYKGDMRGVGGDDPIAWMLLPKPYKAEILRERRKDG